MDVYRYVCTAYRGSTLVEGHGSYLLWLTPLSGTVMRGKLHLIDLAGSERLSKTGAQVRSVCVYADGGGSERRERGGSMV